MNYSEIIVFVIYLMFMISIGVFFFVKSKNGGEKTYFLGGRQMGAWVAALSAGASDMSAWVLMGLPTSIYALGLGQVCLNDIPKMVHRSTKEILNMKLNCSHISKSLFY